MKDAQREGQEQEIIGSVQEKVLGPEVLYLDFDGVLHPEDVYRHPKRGIYLGPHCQGHSLFEHADLLTHLLRPYPAVRLVLSTSWVRVLSYSRAAKWLPVELRNRLIGATFHSSFDETLFLSMPRGIQVFSDVRRRRPTEWVALDDSDEGWPEAQRERWVQTDHLLGLSRPDVLERLKSVLRSRFVRFDEAPPQLAGS